MAIIYREIESLKSLIRELNKRGINEFKSLSDIKSFINYYENEKLKILEDTKSEINQDVIILRDRVNKNKDELNSIVTSTRNKLNAKIELLSNRKEELKNNDTNIIFRFFFKLIYYFLSLRLYYLNKNYEKIVQKKSKKLEKKILLDQSAIDYIFKNKEVELSRRSKDEIEKITFVHKTLSDLYTLILGAEGESLVVKKIKELSDDYILINDFNIRFQKPIYNKRKRDTIYSIQIDHLLVSPAGIFLIETKNWSNKSINSLDLRSPVEQIQRTSYAIYFILNNTRKLRKIGRHHWGESQIPVKNLIVMINNKPDRPFKYVKVLRLNELNRYIANFDKIFSKDEVDKIANTLLNLL